MELLDDKYQIDQLLGRGGLGAVYRATHPAQQMAGAYAQPPHFTIDYTGFQN